MFAIAWPHLVPDIEPGYPLTERAKVQQDGTFMMTMDVTDRDLWVAFDMGQGTRVAHGDAPDLLIRRYVLRAPGGAKDLGKTPLAEATTDPDNGWTEDTVVDGDWMNTALERWYDYSMSNHLLTSKRHTYALRRPGGGVVYFAVESYYCDPPGSGCMTIRYRLGR
ncbi:MAG: hypothetical protein QF464_21630 [Myxococcota bacterium]|nr:hypothetical protein [Myxococcota bacterium]